MINRHAPQIPCAGRRRQPCPINHPGASDGGMALGRGGCGKNSHWRRRGWNTRTILLPQPARWPGWAPCWRHEDFPYLTVTEMVDLAAGVRIAARHCFMLETLSVHVRPKIWVKGPDEARVGARATGSSRGGELLRDAFDVPPRDDANSNGLETEEDR